MTEQTNDSSTEEQLTLFAEDSPASHSLLPASDEARRMIVTSGRKCSELYRKQSPLGSLVRMLMGSPVWCSSKAYLEWKATPLPAIQNSTISSVYTHDKRKCYSSRSAKTFNSSVTKYSRSLFRLQVSMPPTDDSEHGFWQTVVADDSSARKNGKFNNRGEPKLSAQAQMYPTPTTMDHLPPRSVEAKQRQYAGQRKGRNTPGNLREWFDPAMWPTPKANDYKGSVSLKRAEESARGVDLPEQLAVSMQQDVAGLLNPEWVEWLMGFPIGHTELKDSETP